MKAHMGTYGGFISLLKWTLPIIAAITMLIVILISS